MSHVNIDNGGRPGDEEGEYKKLLEEIARTGDCPFCEENLPKYHTKPILKVGNHWIVTTNRKGYENSKYHFLFILRAHKIDSKDLSPEEKIELFEHIAWLDEEYEIPGGSLLMRCGDTALTGATVTHLHAHYVIADFDNPDRKPIMARIG